MSVDRLRPLLDGVRRRWRTHGGLRLAGRAALAASVPILLAAAIGTFINLSDSALAWLAVVTILAAGAAAVTRLETHWCVASERRDLRRPAREVHRRARGHACARRRCSVWSGVRRRAGERGGGRTSRDRTGSARSSSRARRAGSRRSASIGSCRRGASGWRRSKRWVAPLCSACRSCSRRRSPAASWTRHGSPCSLARSVSRFCRATRASRQVNRSRSGRSCA